MARLLLDTHIVLWAVTDPGRLGRLRPLLADPSNQRLVSAAVVWEVAVKSGLGRLDLGRPIRGWAGRVATDLAADRVPVTCEHAEVVADLPIHHRDPFDRLLMAQAQVLDAVLVTADPILDRYDVTVCMP